MNELHLFAGAGGGILAGQLLGHRTVCAVEFEPYAQAVLVARQNDGSLPPFPIWDDVRTFDGNPWRGTVDLVAGGFPCQDISAAGKGAGLSGERSGLWSEMARIIGEVRPRYAFIENSPMLVSRGLDRVLSDLAKMGFDAEWCCLSAADCGAWHERDRIWILATNREYDGFGRGEQFTQSNKKRMLPTIVKQDSRHAVSRHINPKSNHWESNLGEVLVALTGLKKWSRNFAEWMMGWPIGHTVLQPLETDKYQLWLQQHGKSFQKD